MVADLGRKHQNLHVCNSDVLVCDEGRIANQARKSKDRAIFIAFFNKVKSPQSLTDRKM
jgi:hypothetical protein